MMMLGLAVTTFGYAIFYWGQHHFYGKRYSLWCLLGLGSLFPGVKTFQGTNPTNAPGASIAGSVFG